MIDTAIVLLVVAVLLAVVAACQPLAVRLRLPSTALLGAVGVALGALPTGLSALGWSGPVDAFAEMFARLPISSSTYIYVFLPLLVFEAGLATDVRRMMEDAAPILMLAIIATLVATAVVGLALWPLAGVPLVACLLLGAVVSTTDPAAVIAIFRDVGAPARLTRLAEGEALLNDAAAIVLSTVLFGVIATGREPDIGSALLEFFVSFVGGGLLGIIAGHVLLRVIPWMRDDRLAEATLTVGLAYGVFVVAERFLHVSGVAAVLAAALVVSATGRSRIVPENWTFLTELWDQVAFWARSLVFVLASILVPKLLGTVGWHDLLLLGVLVVAALAARLMVLFGLLPVLERLKLAQPISAAYKVALTWGGLRGALTLVLALAATEHPSLPHDVQRFVALLATGFVLFTLFVNGTTLRLVIGLLGVVRLSPRDEILRDRVLALSYAEAADAVIAMGQNHALSEEAIARVAAPYRSWIAAADARDAGQRLQERDRLAIALVALANQERMLALQARAERIASPGAVQILLQNADALAEGARADGRLGYRRAAAQALEFPASFHFAFFLHRHLSIIRPLADRLAERVELLLVTRLLIDRLQAFNDRRIAAIFGARIAEVAAKVIGRRRQEINVALEALRLQYPDYLAALEVRSLRQAALRQEASRYRALFDEGLIPHELYEHLKRGVTSPREQEARPRLDLGLDTRHLVGRLDMLSGLDKRQLDRVAKLLRPLFTVPGTRILRAGDRADACYFIASGAVEVRLPDRTIALGTGAFFGELALLTGRPRQADVVALTFCRLLTLRRADFAAFLAESPEAKAAITRIAATRIAENEAIGR
ncbi:MAG: cation:proton antiporter [Reyranella sp.]|nr:cation:proton antiporter [Reyranella sp.]